MRRTLITLLTMLSFALLPVVARGQLLKGTVSGNIDEMTIAISLDGTMLATEYRPIEISADGTFLFDVELKTPFNDVMLEFNSKGQPVGICGAHLVAGETLSLAVAKTETGELSLQFDGKYKDISEFYTHFVRACEVMQYVNNQSYEANRATLTAGVGRVKQLLPLIGDVEFREYYTRSLEAAQKQVMCMLLQKKVRAENKQPREYAEYNELMRNTDINDEIGLKYGLPGSLVSAYIAPGLFIPLQDMTPYALRFMDVVDSLGVTSRAVRKELCNHCAFSYFTYGKGGDYEKFWKRFTAFARDYPEVIAEYAPRIEVLDRTRKGKEAYDVGLTDPEGKSMRLSGFFGTLLYIDVWATWCGPCCAEIPELEKVVKHYQGNDNIRFISISIDSDSKAWKAKLAEDKPAWPQFILDRKVAKQFQADWGISGIPRFILIDKHGKIYNGDAMRPSDEGIIPLLDKVMNE